MEKTKRTFWPTQHYANQRPETLHSCTRFCVMATNNDDSEASSKGRLDLRHMKTYTSFVTWVGGWGAEWRKIKSQPSQKSLNK